MNQAAILVRPKAQRIDPRDAAEFYRQTYEWGLTGGEVNQALREAHEWEAKWTSLGREGAHNPSPLQTSEIHEIQFKRKLSTSEDSDASSLSLPEEKKQFLIRPKPVRLHKPSAVPSHLMTDDTRSVSPMTLAESQSGPTLIQDEDEQEEAIPATLLHPTTTTSTTTSLQVSRDGLLEALIVSHGETKSPEFQECLEALIQAKANTRNHKGLWLNLTKPLFFDCLGENADGDPMYTLGRMSFDMFGPSKTVCSLQGTFNRVQQIKELPKYMPKSMEIDLNNLFTYNIITAFTIEACEENPNQRPVRGIMTTYGYMVADPSTPNRHSVWITGGKIEPDPRDVTEWRKVFHDTSRSLSEQAKVLAVKLIMGAEFHTLDDNSMEYVFTRPLGGHGTAYIDTLYLDSSLRIVRGHRGTLFVFSRQSH